MLAFTAAVSILTAVVCGFAPAFEGSRTDVQETLKDGARQVGAGVRHRRLRQTFVVAEIALAVVLLVGAGLMLRSFGSLQRRRPRLRHDATCSRCACSCRPRSTATPTAPPVLPGARRRASRVPGVRAAGVISYLPLAGLGAGTGFTIVGQPPPQPGQDHVTDVSVCDNGYFRAMNVPLVRGRLFTEREMRTKSNVVIVNEALARSSTFRSEDPLGKRLMIAMTDPNVPTEIIGVVGDIKIADLATRRAADDLLAAPAARLQRDDVHGSHRGDPLSFAPAIEREMHAIDKDQPVSDVRTMDQWVSRSLAQAVSARCCSRCSRRWRCCSRRSASTA